MNDKAPFRVEKEGHLSWLILDRPEKRNTMSLRFFAGLTEHFEQFDADPEVRVVIVRAEGKSFTAGMDLRMRRPWWATVRPFWKNVRPILHGSKKRFSLFQNFSRR